MSEKSDNFSLTKGKRKAKAAGEGNKMEPVSGATVKKGGGKRKANALGENPTVADAGNANQEQGNDVAMMQGRGERKTKAIAEDDEDNKAKRTVSLNSEDFNLPANWTVQGVSRKSGAELHLLGASLGRQGWHPRFAAAFLLFAMPPRVMNGDWLCYLIEHIRNQLVNTSKQCV